MTTNFDEPVKLGDVDVDALFKDQYGQYYPNAYNENAPMHAMLQSFKAMYGQETKFPVPFGIKGGVGSGSLPEATNYKSQQVAFEAKSNYAKTLIDRKTIQLGKNDAGAFVNILNNDVKKTTESFKWNEARQFSTFGSTGKMGVLDGAVTGSGTEAAPYVCTLKESDYIFGVWEENLLVQVGPTAGTAPSSDLFLVYAFDPTAKTVSLVRQTSGTEVPADTDILYMQGSFGEDYTGVLEVLLANESDGDSLYGIDCFRRWEATQKSAAGAAISESVINETLEASLQKCGSYPKAAFVSHKQMGNLKSLLGDLKRYNPVTHTVGYFSYKGIEIQTDSGSIKVFADKFVRDSDMIFLNFDHIDFYKAPGDGWINDDVDGLNGSGYLRLAAKDEYEGRMACYGEIFIAPTWQAIITDLDS